MFVKLRSQHGGAEEGRRVTDRGGRGGSSTGGGLGDGPDASLSRAVRGDRPVQRTLVPECRLGLMLLLRPDPNRPPRRVQDPEVLVCHSPNDLIVQHCISRAAAAQVQRSKGPKQVGCVFQRNEWATGRTQHVSDLCCLARCTGRVGLDIDPFGCPRHGHIPATPTKFQLLHLGHLHTLHTALPSGSYDHRSRESEGISERCWKAKHVQVGLPECDVPHTVVADVGRDRPNRGPDTCRDTFGGSFT